MKIKFLFFLLASLIFLSNCKIPTDKADSNKPDPSNIDPATLPNIITPEVLWKFGRLSDIQLSPDKKTILYAVKYFDAALNKGDQDLFTIVVDGGQRKRLTTMEGSEYNGLWRPDGKKIGFLAANKDGVVQLWEMNTDGSDQKIISKIEGGITGFSYSPTGDKILFTKDVKIDKTPTEIYPDLDKANVRIIDNLMYRHWDNWHDYAYSHVFIATYKDGNIGELKDIMMNEPFDCPMMPDGGMEQINWSNDGKRIAYSCKKLSGKAYAVSTNSEIYVYDLENETTTNITEKGFEGYDHDPVFSPDGSMLVWKSMEENGFEADKERIILYDFASGKTEDLSKNFDQSSSSFQWSKDGKLIYFISGHHATYQIYSVDRESREIKAITQGDHNYQSFVLADKLIVGTKMNISMPTEVFTINAEGKEEQLTFTNKTILDKVKMGKVEKRWIKTTDNKQMLTWVIYPPDFDPNKKYPTLLYCQGGPQSAVSQFFSYRWNFQIMAANGYIVVAPNRRGLPTFGQEWNDQISGDYGGQNMKDYLSAIDEISKEPFVDRDHLGAVGASYGGFSVFWLAGNHNKRFKALISHCGMFNLESQYGATEEYFFVNKDLGGAYWEKPKPKCYTASPHLFVDKWDTPILIITSANDLRIPYTESLQAFNAAQLRGIPSKLLFFPEESHFVLKPQNSILWQREFFKWLDTYLKP